MTPRLPSIILPALVVCLAGAGPASAQSLVGSQGLGVPVESIDSRARALGAAGPGLFGATLNQSDPGGMADVALPMITATMQPTWGDYTRGATSGDLNGTRFPMVGVAYPFPGIGVFSASYGAFLDQRWAAERAGTFTIGGLPVAGTDRFESDGGVAQLHLGYARRVTERVGVGLTVGRYTGRVDRSFTRTFDTASVSSGVAPFEDVDNWTYGGSHLTVGAVFDPIPQIRVGGSFGWSGSLEAEPGPDTEGGTLSFDLPSVLRVGASGALTSRLMATVGVQYADWSGVDAVLDTTSAAGQTLGLGAGLEWGGPRFLGRTLPVRLGYRRLELPFGHQGSDPVESSISAGLGFNLSQVDEFPLAALDFTLERGSRSDAPLEERFWRATLTLKVSGG